MMPRKPTRRHKMLISSAGLDPADYMVLHDLPTELIIIRRGDDAREKAIILTKEASNCAEVH